MAAPGGGNLFQENASGRGMFGELAPGQPSAPLSVSQRRGNRNFSIYHVFLITMLSLDQIASRSTQRTLD